MPLKIAVRMTELLIVLATVLRTVLSTVLGSAIREKSLC